MFVKFFIVCILDLKSFGGQASKNVHDIQKLVFRRASVSLYGGLVCTFCLKPKNSRDDPRLLIDMLRIKTSGYDSQRTTPKGPQGGPKHWTRRLLNEACSSKIGDQPRIARL